MELQQIDPVPQIERVPRLGDRAFVRADPVSEGCVDQDASAGGDRRPPTGHRHGSGNAFGGEVAGGGVTQAATLPDGDHGAGVDAGVDGVEHAMTNRQMLAALGHDPGGRIPHVGG